jgi:hypothetical protein
MKISSASIALSGIMAGFKRLAISADNVARRNVVNSEKNRVVQEAQAGGGTTALTKKVPLKAEEKIVTTDTAFDSTSSIASNIDYAEEGVNQNIASIATQSAFAIYEKSKELEDTIINLKT